MTLVAIIDDDVSVVRATKRLLNSRGIEAATFSSGTEFINFTEQAAGPVLDCIVLDVHMDGVNGLDVQRYLVENEITIPIIFISSAVEPWIRDQAIAAGAVAFFDKPFDPEAFLDLLETVIAPQRDGDARPPND
jgi:FixJ family two-component response regulator